MGACTPMRAHRVRQRAGARRRAARLRRACGEGVSVACHARNPEGGRCMRIGLQSLAGSSARIERLRGFLAHFSRSPCFSLTSRPLLPRFSPSSRPLLVRLFRASPPLLACFALRSAAIRRRSCALRRGAGARCRRTGKMRAFFARHRATRPPGRCREDADRAPRLYRRSYPRYYNPPIAEQ